MTEPSHLRLFLAAHVPPDLLIRTDAATAPLRATLTGARWTPVENQHVTLKFLGRTEVEHVAPIKEACRSVAAEIGPAPIALDGLGAFPNPRKARVLWVGVVDESQVLERVAGALDSALTPLGFEPESRTFTAHLTTARFKQPATLDPSSLDVRPPDDPFLFSSFSLMASHLSPKGARYEEVERFELKGV